FGTTFWSKQLGIGRTRLFSRIKDITGMTPNEYILHMKMAKATLLLKETTLTISEIAYQLGFSIPAYFSKCFKKQFGVTPADYRKGGLK
ncbi:AraC family transcriptional regulator, partial [Parabacteroides sp. OttesenSCG-928-K15]|nr:AraC family transcriptional regulator [Parabacteroides sp. OttesenSCG-928-K15]